MDQTKNAIHVLTLTVFSLALMVGVMLLAYAIVATLGFFGNTFTNVVVAILKRQNSAFAIFGAVITALPAASFSISNDESGAITTRGLAYIYLLVPTLVLAATANILLEPAIGHPGGLSSSELVDTTSLRLTAFALTFLTAIFGLKALVSKPGA